MAKKGGKKDEHQMLFDLRGKRRNVVKVVYAVLALLMGLSLLLVAGPLPFGDIFGGQDARELAREQSEERIERIEVKLKQDPENAQLLGNLLTAQVQAGNNEVEEVAPGQIAVTTEALQQYEQAASTWDEYMAATDEPSANVAQQAAGIFFSLAENARGAEAASRNIDAWAEAQRVVAEQRPSLGSLSTLALYLPYTSDFAGARKAAQEAKQFATSRFQRQQLEQQLEQTEKAGREFQKQLKEEKAAQKQANESAQSGGEFVNPFSLGGQ